MTAPDGAEHQEADPYPLDFALAVKPGEVTTALCEHEEDPAACGCVHDWRIFWGNVEKRSTRPRTAVL
ncbi:hypothetical protein ASE48_08380 [Mycobacterium sp. Root265]|nr:hypothetical protein ASE48_08380 [Mycobacterium sp. Root265]